MYNMFAPQAAVPHVKLQPANMEPKQSRTGIGCEMAGHAASPMRWLAVLHE